jgi:hypothetical protein
MADGDAPVLDPSVVAGSAAPPPDMSVTPQMPVYAGPTGGDTGMPPSLEPNVASGVDQAAAQAPPTPQGDGSAGNPIVLPPRDSSNTSFNVPQKPGVMWKNVIQQALQGALSGLQGIPDKGRPNFLSGVGEGARAAHANQQQAIQNQFESVKAADSHIAALDEHNFYNYKTAEAKQIIASNSEKYQKALLDDFGIMPSGVFQDSADGANAATNVSAQGNGGTIPQTSVLHQPADDGQHGKIVPFNPTAQQFQQNANGFRDMANQQRRALGQPDIDPLSWNTMGLQGWKGASAGAIDFFKPNPTYSTDPSKPNFVGTMLKEYQQYEENYANHKGADGKPDANPQLLGNMQKAVSFLQDGVDTMQKGGFSEQKGVPVDPAAKQSFIQKILPSLNNIPAQERAGLAAEAKNVQTREEFDKLQDRADASDKAWLMHYDSQRQQNALKSITFAQKALEDNEKAWSSGPTSFTQAHTQIQTLNRSIDAAKDGNGLLTAFVPTMEVLGVNMQGGIRRISPTEADAARTNPQLITRWNALFDAASSGKLSPELVQQGHQLANILDSQKYMEARQQSAFAAQTGGITDHSQVPAMFPNGGVTTLDKAEKVAGTTKSKDPNDKSVYYVDRQGNILGVAGQ